MKWMIEGISFSFRKINFPPLNLSPSLFFVVKVYVVKKLQEAIGIDFK
jgi:hypothetical protein